LATKTDTDVSPGVIAAVDDEDVRAQVGLGDSEGAPLLYDPALRADDEPDALADIEDKGPGTDVAGLYRPIEPGTACEQPCLTAGQPGDSAPGDGGAKRKKAEAYDERRCRCRAAQRSRTNPEPIHRTTSAADRFIHGEPVNADYAVDRLPLASTSFVGRKQDFEAYSCKPVVLQANGSFPSIRSCEWTLQELIAADFAMLEWDGM
jgi:hypothetical protein